MGGNYEAKAAGIFKVVFRMAVTVETGVKQTRNMVTGKTENSSTGHAFAGVEFGIRLGKLGGGIRVGPTTDSDKLVEAKTNPDGDGTVKFSGTIPVVGPLIGIQFTHEVNVPAASRAIANPKPLVDPLSR